MPDPHQPARPAGRRRAVPLAAAAAVLACLAAAPSLPALAQISERLDTNGDGFMDQKEAQDSALAKFQALDQSRDGALSDAEIGLAQGAPNPLDKNADGLVSFDEYWLYFGNVFSAADSNRDGRLSPDELQSMRQ